MKIAIDLRSLQSGTVSGVENYTLNLLAELLAMDKKNTYTLFYNFFRDAPLPEFNYINARTVKARFPSRLLNLMFKFGASRLEKFTGDFDCLFMPNLNVINIRSKAKLALTVHDLSFATLPEFYDLKRKLWHKFLNVKKLLNRADWVFAVSEYTKTDLIRLYNLSEEKIRVIYPGVDLEIFNPQIRTEGLREARNLYNLPAEYFLFLNTIEPRKNLIGAVEAFELAKTRAHLVVAGKKGWKTFKIFQRLKKVSQSGRIHYLGYAQEAHKPALIKMATAVLYPSFYEGFGFQALEAMAVGTPVIASQVTSLPEVVGDAGILVNPYNPLDLAQAMKTMENNPGLRQALINRGLARVKLFNWRQNAAQVLESLEKL